MAKENKKVKTIDNWKKKKWFQIVAPKLFNNLVLGECPVDDAQKLNARVITSNMMTLTGDMKRKNTSVSFQVKEISNNKAMTELVGYQLAQSSLKRVVRKGKDRLDESFTVKTKDDLYLRIKIMMLSLNNTSRSVHSAMRDELQYQMKMWAKQHTCEEIFTEILENKLSRSLKKTVDKVFPLRSLDIRYLKIEPNGKMYKDVAERSSKAKADDAEDEKPQKKTVKKARKFVKKEEVAETPAEESEKAEKEDLTEVDS